MSQMNRVARVYDRALIEGLRRTAPERAKGVSLMRVWLTKSEGRFSNRPFEVKRFQTIRRCGVDVTHGLVLLFGIGTKAVPSWDSRTRWNNLFRGLAVRPTAGSSGHANSPHPSSGACADQLHRFGLDRPTRLTPSVLSHRKAGVIAALPMQ